MPGNHKSAAFALVLVHGPGKDIVQRVDLALDAATVPDVDERKLRGREDVAGHNHVRGAKVDDAVAIGHRVALPEHLDRFVVVKRPSTFFQAN
jgi:hypothetical protein